MSLTINRLNLIQSLESVSPGLGKTVEQSDSYVFHKGDVFTYNGEVACRTKSPLKINGALKHQSIAKILPQLTDEVLSVVVETNCCKFLGKRKEIKVAFDPEVKLPFAIVEKPKEADWITLPDNFLEALGLVLEAIGDDEEKFLANCLHVHPKWIEGTDNTQIMRYRMKTGVQNPILIKKGSIKHLLNMEVEQMCETENWIHFRSADNKSVTYSCLKSTGDYLDLTPIVKIDVTQKITFPKAMKDIAIRASLPAFEIGKAEAKLTVKLKNGKLMVNGIGATAEYSEWSKARYAGPDLEFQIPPLIFVQLVEKFETVGINDNVMKVKSEDFVYMCSLSSEKSELKEPESAN